MMARLDHVRRVRRYRRWMRWERKEFSQPWMKEWWKR